MDLVPYICFLKVSFLMHVHNYSWSWYYFGFFLSNAGLFPCFITREVGKRRKLVEQGIHIRQL